MASTGEQTNAIFDKIAKDYEKNFAQMITYAKVSLTLAPPIDGTSHVHDNASGPGIVTGAILESNPSARIDATDISEAMVGATKLKYAKDGQVTAQVMDVMDLNGFEDNRFTHSFTNFVFVIMKPDECRKGAKEIYRTVKPGGTAVVLGWERIGWKFDFLEPAMATVAKELGKPTENLLDGFREVTAGQFEGYAKEAGFTDVKTEFRSRDMPGSDIAKEVMDNMFVFFVEMVAKEWTEDERKKLMDLIAKRRQEQKENPSKFEMKAWFSVMKK